MDLGSCLKQLEVLLENDPFTLVDIDCDQIEKWQELAQHIPEDVVIDKLIDLINDDNFPIGEWSMQFLEDAGGAVVNMDYFPVNISTLPNNPITGQQFTPNQFLDYIRRNINDFLGPSSFEPYCEIASLCEQETSLWNSNNPLGTIVKIDIPLSDGEVGDILGNDGVVICSEFTNDHWNFTTLEAPLDSNHPVSGSRSFGYETNTDGSFNFYIRGVDRFESELIFDVVDLIVSNPFFGADELWGSFQEGLDEFVKNNGGTSSIIPAVKNRPDWEEVKDVLEGTKPISDLGCN